MHNILNPQQIQSFMIDGFVRIDHAFSPELASQVRGILWNDLLPLKPDEPDTWKQPVIRLGMYSNPPFIRAANTTVLHQAFDQLVGAGRWMPCMSMGTFPVRFPSDKDPGDTGLHVDAGFPGAEPNDYFSWRINIKSKGRALLMLFLFSNVGEQDAPTRILKSSHLDIARALKPEGDAGLSFMELAQIIPTLPQRSEVLATGEAGTVYLCHPFLVHGAQKHQGTEPKFMAQPPLLPISDFDAHGIATQSPVEQAITFALNL